MIKKFQKTTSILPFKNFFNQTIISIIPNISNSIEGEKKKKYKI